MDAFPTGGRWAATLLVAWAILASPQPTAGQASGLRPVPAAPSVQIADPHLTAALSRLLAGSPSADAVIAALASSGLPVTIGTPAELAAAVADDGTRSALLPDASGLAAAAEPQLAWVGFRVGPDAASAGIVGTVEQAWIVVDVDRMQQLIEEQDRVDKTERLEDDLTIALGHELVAHVGSVAASRRIEDLCDDPVAGEAPGRGLACSLRVENQVRRELNRNLALRGARRFPERTSYALEVMNFAGAGR